MHKLTPNLLNITEKGAFFVNTYYFCHKNNPTRNGRLYS